MKKLLSMSVILFCASVTVCAAANYDPTDVKKFKEINSCPSCNLSGASIYDNHQHANLTNANLSNADLQGDYTLADFSGANAVGVEISSASGAKFVDATLIKGRLRGNFTDADFSNANVSAADFSNANLYHAKLTNQQLSSARTICDAILPDGTTGKCN